MRTKRLMGYFKETRGWGEEADRWLGEGVLANWRMTSKAMHQRIATVRIHVYIHLILKLLKS